MAGCHREAGTTIKPMYGCCIMTWKLLWIPLLTKPHTQMAYIQDGRDTPLQLLFSCSVVSDSLQPYGLQHARLPCPSPSPGVCWNSCPFSWWCHPTISSSVIPFSTCLQSFPASGSFPKWVSSSHQLAKVLELQLQHQSFQWIFRVISFRIDWLDLLAVQGTLKSLLQHHSSKALILLHSAFFIVQLSGPYMTARKTIALIRWTFVWQSNVSAF